MVQVPVLARIALLLGGVLPSCLGCTQVLGIPGEPQLRNAKATGQNGEVNDSSSTVTNQGTNEVERSSGEALLRAMGATEGVENIPLTTALDPVSAGTQSHVDAGDAGIELVQPFFDAGASLDAAVPEPNDCPVFAVRGPEGFCYSALTTPQSWQDSRNACLALGTAWDLASIRSELENDFVRALGVDELWLGASDQAENGTWLWVDDNTGFWLGDQESGQATGNAYVNWNANEPNGGGGSGCARIVAAVSGTWADLKCASELAALCKGPPGRLLEVSIAGSR